MVSLSRYFQCFGKYLEALLTILVGNQEIVSGTLLAQCLPCPCILHSMLCIGRLAREITANLYAVLWWLRAYTDFLATFALSARFRVVTILRFCLRWSCAQSTHNPRFSLFKTRKGEVQVLDNPSFVVLTLRASHIVAVIGSTIKQAI